MHMHMYMEMEIKTVVRCLCNVIFSLSFTESVYKQTGLSEFGSQSQGFFTFPRDVDNHY